MTMLGLDASVPRVQIGPFWVADLTMSQVTDRLVQLAMVEDRPARAAYALHVGGLNARDQEDFAQAMRGADLVYADGGSVVWLAKLAGARSVQRAPTTDLGWDVLRGLTDQLRRPPRVALIGGEPGLAERAGAVLAAGGVAVVVHTSHGFHDDWAEVLSDLRATEAEVVVVGLGAPREMMWTEEHRLEMSAALVLTCGGWFGHLTGAERRAPRLLRRSGLEWIARLAQAPTRLGPRYARGMVSAGVMSLAIIRARRRGR
jgi:N-acetylglucosaminyldiphosphoundecaprenol N-acetyl-beta-D-mannosaminyltransferase